MPANIACAKYFGQASEAPANTSARYDSRMDVRSRRLAWLKHLRDDIFGGRNADLARKIKRSPAQVAQWFSGTRTITEDSARYIEDQLGLIAGFMDRPLASEKVSAREEAASYPVAYSLNESQQIRQAANILMAAAERERSERVLIIADIVQRILEAAPE